MEKIKSYNKALEFMFAQLPMYQRQGKKAFKKDLHNIIALCNKIGNPQLGFKSIHVAGTNGKGSVTHLIACGLMAQGYKVGIYSSPHYVDFRERIKINGVMIPKKRVVDYINRFVTDLQEVRPSFFELTVAMAFKYFEEEKVDFAVIETGLGGRLDSTNIVQPVLTVITNISYDHTFFLGDTLEKIAGEKAGIIKPNVPIIIGEKQEKISHVYIEKARSCNAPLTFASELVSYIDGNIHLQDKERINEIRPDIVGPFLEKNLVTAFAALDNIKSQGFAMDWEKVRDALKTFTTDLHFIGRWQWLSKKPDILADSAHNPAGLRYVLDALKRLEYSKIHFVLGFVNDKELEKVLPLFPPNQSYYFAKANIPRGLDAFTLSQKAEKFNLKGKAYSSVRKALSAAKKKFRSGELVYVGGSIFTVAEVL